MERKNLSIGNSKPALLVALIALVSASWAPAGGQVVSLKDKAIAQFKQHDYPGAIESLRQALDEAPDDADVYYYLGYFTHYLCYDSVPLTGFGRHKSDEILHYLQKAVEIDPHYGNAYYFIGAEYGARARYEMQSGHSEGIGEQFRLGRQAGGYPDWLVEYGRNTLRSCGQGAILFTGGDADTNPVQYLQYVEGYRTDVTVIPVPLLDLPWFVALLKRGSDGVVGRAPISWDDGQIESMHPYKWKTNTIRIPVPEDLRREHQIDQAAVEWELAPNLGHGGELGLLSPGRAAFADIILTNNWKRPIYFSMGCRPSAMDGLSGYVQLYGFAQRLLPLQAPSRVDAEATRVLLLDERNFQSLPTLRDSDMPKASPVLQNYRSSFLTLIIDYYQAGQTESAREALAAMNAFVPENLLPVPENLKRNIETLERTLSEPEKTDH